MTASSTSDPSTCNLEPATCNSAPFLAHRRTGKVARLPAEQRELVNLMLHDGAPYSRIIKKLAERGHSLNARRILNSLCALSILHPPSFILQTPLRPVAVIRTNSRLFAVIRASKNKNALNI